MTCLLTAAPEDRERYGRAEQEASAKKAGLWRDPNPVPPWDWRHDQQKKRMGGESGS